MGARDQPDSANEVPGRDGDRRYGQPQQRDGARPEAHAGPVLPYSAILLDTEAIGVLTLADPNVAKRVSQFGNVQFSFRCHTVWVLNLPDFFLR